jgi:hypothetical protein
MRREGLDDVAAMSEAGDGRQDTTFDSAARLRKYDRTRRSTTATGYLKVLEFDGAAKETFSIVERAISGEIGVDGIAPGALTAELVDRLHRLRKHWTTEVDRLSRLRAVPEADAERVFRSLSDRTVRGASNAVALAP